MRSKWWWRRDWSGRRKYGRRCKSWPWRLGPMSYRFQGRSPTRRSCSQQRSRTLQISQSMCRPPLQAANRIKWSPSQDVMVRGSQANEWGYRKVNLLGSGYDGGRGTAAQVKVSVGERWVAHTFFHVWNISLIDFSSPCSHWFMDKQKQ